MNLITEYFTYTHLVNVIQQTESKGRYAGFSASLSFMLQSLCCHWALGVPVWAVSSAGKRTTPPPPSSPHPKKKSPKQNSDCCLFREEISPGLRTNCLEKSLQQSDPCLSTAYCRRGVCFPAAHSSLPAPLGTGGRERGWARRCLRKQIPLQRAWWAPGESLLQSPGAHQQCQASSKEAFQCHPHLHLSSSNYATGSLNLVLQLLQVT